MLQVIGRGMLEKSTRKMRGTEEVGLRTDRSQEVDFRAVDQFRPRKGRYQDFRGRLEGDE
jgi:hypothetical protein